MRFNSYFVRLSHSQECFQGNLQVAGQTHAVGFRKIAPGLFTAHFKGQVELRFRQPLEFKNSRGSLVVLLPVLAQYNQRKMKRMAALLAAIDEKSFAAIIAELLAVENFLDLEGLLYFFSLERQEAVAVLTELEIARQAKAINLNYLFATSWSHFEASLAAMAGVLRAAYEGRERSVKFAALEKKLKIPQESVFFKYLLKKCSQAFPCRILASALVFSQLPLSDEEKGRIAEIEKALRVNRLPLFTFDAVSRHTAFSQKQINDALWYMIEEERILQLDEQHFIFSEEYGKIINRLKKFKRNQGDVLTFEDLRELTAYSRKYLIVLFEFWDRQNITRRVGNKRKILLGA